MTFLRMKWKPYHNITNNCIYNNACIQMFVIIISEQIEMLIDAQNAAELIQLSD